MVITHTIMQNRHRALIWNVVWYHSHIMNAVAAAKPMSMHTQNHFLKRAPAMIAAPIVTTIEKPTRPMNGFGKPKASACGVRHHRAAAEQGVDIADRGVAGINVNLQALIHQNR